MFETYSIQWSPILCAFVCVQQNCIKEYWFFTCWFLPLGRSHSLAGCCKSLFSSLAVWVSACLTTDTCKMRIQMLFSASIIHWFWSSNYLRAQNLECFLLGAVIFFVQGCADTAADGGCKVWVRSSRCYLPARTALSFQDFPAFLVGKRGIRIFKNHFKISEWKHCPKSWSLRKYNSQLSCLFKITFPFHAKIFRT